MTTLMRMRRPDFNWEGMMKWWTAHSDGTPLSLVSEERNFRHGENCDDEADVGFYDVDQRVHHIGINLIDDGPDGDEGGVAGFPYSVDKIVGLLVELQELAEYVDITKELHSGNYLAPLFQKVLCHKYEAGIYNRHAVVRRKAAEVVTTMVHNNPTNQQLVMEANGLQHLLDNFISDPDPTARTKALVAISSLIRNNKLGITEFRKENVGYAALRDALNSESVRFQWEALNLIQYLLHENSSDCNIVTQFGIPYIMMHLTCSDDAQVREATLRGLLVLATNDGGQALLVLARDEGGQEVRSHNKLKNSLQVRIKRIRAMPLEDLSAAREEIQLVDSLWNTFFNEPSSLRDVLPGVTRLLTT